MNRKKRNWLKMWFRKVYEACPENCNPWAARKTGSPVKAARRRGINRKLARLHFGLSCKRIARRFVEAL